MTDEQFIEFALDRLLESAMEGATEEARQQSRSFCPGCWAAPLARIFVREIWGKLKDGSVTRELVIEAGSRAAVRVSVYSTSLIRKIG